MNRICCLNISRYSLTKTISSKRTFSWGSSKDTLKSKAVEYKRKAKELPKDACLVFVTFLVWSDLGYLITLSWFIYKYKLNRYLPEVSEENEEKSRKYLPWASKYEISADKFQSACLGYVASRFPPPFTKVLKPMFAYKMGKFYVNNPVLIGTILVTFYGAAVYFLYSFLYHG